MKNFYTVIGFMIGLFCLLFISVSCGNVDRVEYECTITYTLGGCSFTETHKADMPVEYIPGYSCGKNRDGENKIRLIGSGRGDYQIYYTDIYKGIQPVSVESFNYKIIRTYKASRWNGHEIKKKK